MGIRSRLGVEGKPSLSARARLGATIKRVTDVLLPISRESISVDMLVSNCLPYQASKTYRRLMAESDCGRAETMLEVQRARGRG